jgi:septum formation protein
MPPDFILASASPRRKELLQKAGFIFHTCPSFIEEPSEALAVSLLVKKLAFLKALAVSQSFPHSPILAADTLIAFQNQILGKPKTLEEAQSMLSQLANQTHTVWTAYCLFQGTEKQAREVSTLVTFPPLTPLQIERYVKECHPLDKAGAYGIQELSPYWEVSIQGSLTSVIGLPLEEVQQDLAHLQIFPRVSSLSF